MNSPVFHQYYRLNIMLVGKRWSDGINAGYISILYNRIKYHRVDCGLSILQAEDNRHTYK